jgi:hypothetical protein
MRAHLTQTLVTLFPPPPSLPGQAFTMNAKVQAAALAAVRSVHPTIGKSLFTAPVGASVASLGTLSVDVARCVRRKGEDRTLCGGVAVVHAMCLCAWSLLRAWFLACPGV